MGNCFFCNATNFEKEGRKLKLEDKEGYWYLSVPKHVGSYGQVLFIISKLNNEDEHIKNITDSSLINDKKRLISIMTGISEISKKLLCLKDKFGRKVEKVYVITQCESVNHLHFHLIPRYEGDSQGNEFLYKNEIEEARWDNENCLTPSVRINSGNTIINDYRKKIETDQFFFSQKHKEETIQNVVKDLNRILKFS